MMCRRALLFSALCLVAVAAATPLPAQAQDSQTQPGYYIVRPGDTLHSIAQRYLGSSERWRDLWQLNRGSVDDPDRIRPGWELRIVWHDLPSDASVLTATWNRVENLRPPRRGWEAAKTHDVLRTRDRLQTYQASSAELLFPDETILRLSEDTLLLLETIARLGSTVERDQVQLLEGQADLEGSNIAPDGLGIELVMGEATAAPEVDEKGEIRTRARIGESQQAQLMVYAGASRLAAGGHSVEVAQGMGSSVTPGEPPAPPEKLLEAPVPAKPESGAALATPRPSFSWQPVAGAESYTVEICRDDVCSLLERRIVSIESSPWQPASKLPKGTFYWRATAVSASGLDGFPAATQPFEVLTDQEDQQLPAVAFRVFPPRLAPRWGLNQQWILGPGARFEAVAEDEASGIDRWTPLLDGEEVSVEQWQGGPWPEGEQMLASFIAIDRAGNENRLEPVSFVFDSTPPAISWGLEGEGAVGELSTSASDFGNLPKHVARRVMEVRDPHRWWAPWAEQRWTIDLDGRQIVLRPNRSVRIAIDGRELVLGPEKGLWILAEDAICDSIFRLDYDLELSQEGRWPKKRSILTLHLEAWDWVENVSRGELRFETIGRK